MDKLQEDSIELDIRQNFVIVWFDEKSDNFKQNYQDWILRLCHIVSKVHVFDDAKKCIDFLIEYDTIDIFIIISDGLAEEFIPAIHSFPQIFGVFIISTTLDKDEPWIKLWSKIKGVHRTVETIHKDLYMIVDKYHEHYQPDHILHIFEKEVDFSSNRPDPTFIWSRLLVNSLRKITYDQQWIKAFVNYMRGKLPDSSGIRRQLNEFEREYNLDMPIVWYTRPGFIEETLDQALQSLEMDVILYMGFFIHDIYNRIERRSESYVDRYRCEPFTVYRGQLFSVNDFEKMQNDQGGLIRFNSIFSAFSNSNIALMYADSAATVDESYGIFFEVIINSELHYTTYTNVHDPLDYRREQQILFTPNTTFQIGEIHPFAGHHRVFQVRLTLVDEPNPGAFPLPIHMKERLDSLAGMDQLIELLICMKKPAMINLLNDITGYELVENHQKLFLTDYHLGITEMLRGDYAIALKHLERNLSLVHPQSVQVYIAIINTKRLLGQYTEALKFYFKCRDFLVQLNREDHPELSEVFNSLGLIHYDMGDYFKAITIFKQALDCEMKRMNRNLMCLSSVCSNMGLVYGKMRKYAKALKFHQMVLSVREKILCPEHSDLVWSYHNLGLVYHQMEKYSEALPWYERAICLQQKNDSSHHPDMGTFYHNIGDLYYHMKEYAKAFNFQQKALDIKQKFLPGDHPEIASSHHSLSLTQYMLGQPLMAIKSIERALQIREKVLPPTHDDLISSKHFFECLRYNSRRYLVAMTVW